MLNGPPCSALLGTRAAAARCHAALRCIARVAACRTFVHHAGACERARHVARDDVAGAVERVRGVRRVQRAALACDAAHVGSSSSRCRQQVSADSSSSSAALLLAGCCEPGWRACWLMLLRCTPRAPAIQSHCEICCGAAASSERRALQQRRRNAGGGGQRAAQCGASAAAGAAGRFLVRLLRQDAARCCVPRLRGPNSSSTGGPAAAAARTWRPAALHSRRSPPGGRLLARRAPAGPGNARLVDMRRPAGPSATQRATQPLAPSPAAPAAGRPPRCRPSAPCRSGRGRSDHRGGAWRRAERPGALQSSWLGRRAGLPAPAAAARPAALASAGGGAEAAGCRLHRPAAVAWLFPGKSGDRRAARSRERGRRRAQSVLVRAQCTSEADSVPGSSVSRKEVAGVAGRRARRRPDCGGAAQGN